MFGVGGSTPTDSPLEAGNAGNGLPALAPEAPGMIERVSVREPPGCSGAGRKGASPELESWTI